MDKRCLLIDDQRKIVADRVARTFSDGIAALRDEGPWDLLLLDHDFGDPDPAKTGYGIMRWLEENPQFLPTKIVFVTANPVGRDNMRAVLKRIETRNETR
jgi:CheY-like chemotaxis protein